MSTSNALSDVANPRNKRYSFTRSSRAWYGGIFIVFSLYIVTLVLFGRNINKYFHITIMLDVLNTHFSSNSSRWRWSTYFMYRFYDSLSSSFEYFRLFLYYILFMTSSNLYFNCIHPYFLYFYDHTLSRCYGKTKTKSK